MQGRSITNGREGAGKVQGRCREGAGKVQGRCREGTGKVQGRSITNGMDSATIAVTSGLASASMKSEVTLCVFRLIRTTSVVAMLTTMHSATRAQRCASWID